MVLITIVMGVYKPTYNWGAPHCMRMLDLYAFIKKVWIYPLGICYIAMVLMAHL